MIRLSLVVALIACVAVLSNSPATAKTKEEKQVAKAAKAERRAAERENKAAKESDADARRAQAKAQREAAATQKAGQAAAESAERRNRTAAKKSNKSDNASRRTATTQPVVAPFSRNTNAAPRSARQETQVPATTGAMPPRRQGSVFQNILEQQRQAAERAKAQAASSGEFESSNEYKPE
jgi:FtsZ-interacting cell division protein ZipA